MKKIIVCLAMAVAIVSCNKTTDAKEFKTAYVDTNKLLDESIEKKDIEEKYKAKADVMDSRLKVAAEKFQSEAASFKQNAMANGQAWAQQKGAELQQREQELQYAQQGMLQQLQTESGKEMDSLVTKYKKIFKEYGKDKGYDYVFGTGEAATVLYAKDSYDITKELIKLVNDKYKAEGKKEEKPADKKEEAKK
ncbi:OmpH family outer membrane protein [Flavobacterium sp.]|jgi:outer membrane protein|uniref:OmpH family outer membrane protein n=1 Tax=Flavobacterium sp. TaxID=239 RepID=UPI000AA0F0AF|nr:OmpH family outer membrane protein [Flavobacterium sp.]